MPKINQNKIEPGGTPLNFYPNLRLKFRFLKKGETVPEGAIIIKSRLVPANPKGEN